MLITIVFVSLLHFSILTTLFEGNLCELHTGERGVCMNALNCTWLTENLSQNKIKFDDIRRCSFKNLNEDIVCCRHWMSKKIECDEFLPKNSKKRPGYIGDIHPGDRGYKARVACKEYSQYSVDLSSTAVIHGTPARRNEVPHIVALGYSNGTNGYSFDCGGTLIAQNWVVTAAHCIKDKRKPVILRMGKLNLQGFDGFDPVDRTISQIIRHPQYSSLRKKNDIALIKFDEDVEFYIDLRPACIQTDINDVPPVVELTTAGWGSIQAEKANRSDVLFKATVFSVPLEKCNQTLVQFNELSDQPSLRGLIESQMCALNREIGSDTCQGDSGGPLFTTEISLATKDLVDPCFDSLYRSLTTLHGIVSFGVSCGTDLPGVYTRVVSYIDWIESIVWP